MHKLSTTIFGYLLHLVLRFVCGTNRLTVTGQEIFDRCVGQGGTIFVFWHSRLFYLAYYSGKRIPRGGLCVLVSRSKDGDYGAALARRLRLDTARGSSSRGGRTAIRRLIDKIMEGGNIAITPDGPRGPAFRVSDGVIKLAQMTGARIVPVAYDATRKHLLRSWDRFVVVLPFGRVHLAFADPMEVPEGCSAEDRQEYAAQLERTLHHLDRVCADHLAGAGARTAPDAWHTPESESEVSTELPDGYCAAPGDLP
ncbi:MAG: DUF374 domain-containing protein [Planctomycetes bacterium]|nr:DUF374 domain-containing protein [Planctomycetota bacterium]